VDSRLFADGQKSIECARGGRRNALAVLSGLCQRIREERLDGLALVGALTSLIGVEIATDFKLIELILRHQNRPPKEASLPALAMPDNRLVDLCSSVRHVGANAGTL
jgi:hypothetical protein